MPIVWKHKFKGSIWRIAIGKDKLIGLEIRDEENLSVEFFKFNVNNFDLEAIESPILDWWTSLLQLDQQHAHFKKYESENDPFSQSLIRMDLAAKEFFKVDSVESTTNQGFQHPVYFTEGTDEWNEVAGFLEMPDGVSLSKGIEYTEKGDFFVVSYHMTYEQSLSRNILIMKTDGQVLFHEETDEKLTGEASECFITFSNLVIFVSNRHELILFET